MNVRPVQKLTDIDDATLEKRIGSTCVVHLKKGVNGYMKVVQKLTEVEARETYRGKFGHPLYT